MYCGECGAKNKNGDAFCGECGSKLENSKKEKKYIKTLNKKTKNIIITVIAIAIIFGILFKVGSSLTGPKSVAKNYIEALMNNDTDKLYNYIEIEGDKTFINKKTFKEIMKEDSKIENYVITDVKYTDSKLNAVVTYSYMTKGGSDEMKDTISLTKSKDKKLLLFDNWKIQDLSTSELILENYEIKVPKNSKIIYAGVDVESKYLDKEKSTEELDVYILPQVFTSESELKIKLANELEFKDTVNPSKYHSTYKINFDANLLTETQKKVIIDSTKSTVTSIYTGIVNNKEVKELDLNIEDLKEIYSDIKKELKSSEITLTSFKINDIAISTIDLDDDNNLEVKLKLKYNYSLKYQGFNDTEKEKDGSSSDYVNLVFEYKDDSFNIKEIEELNLYFSKYF